MKMKSQQKKKRKRRNQRRQKRNQKTKENQETRENLESRENPKMLEQHNQELMKDLQVLQQLLKLKNQLLKEVILSPKNIKMVKTSSNGSVKIYHQLPADTKIRKEKFLSFIH